MRSFLVTACVLIGTCGSALAQIPFGYEVVDLTSGMFLHGVPRINNCGEIVFSAGIQGDDWAEIILYDNGLLIQVTDNDIPDALPDINDLGTIVWTQNADTWGGGEIVILSGAESTIIAQGSSPSINNLGHVAWKVFDPVPCHSPSVIMFFDGESVETIIDDGLSNQSPRLNDNDEMVWTAYDFPCDNWWTSEIKLYSDGAIIALPATSSTPQGPDLNNLGMAAWGDHDILEYWNGLETVVLTDGHRGALNDVGDIAFQHRLTYTCWEVRLYRDGEFLQISDDPEFDNGRADINDAGEIVWRWMPNGAIEPSGIRFMRRVRDGDANFDDDVDLEDFVGFPDCLTGPVDTDHLCECRFLDLDRDRDVDLADFADFQVRFGATELSQDCCMPHEGPGCNDPDVEACVCDANPMCCMDEWYLFCAQFAGYFCTFCP